MTTLIVQAAADRHIARVMAPVTCRPRSGRRSGRTGGVILAFADWRQIFPARVPLCLAGLWLACRNRPTEVPQRGVSLEVIGPALVRPGITAVVYGLSEVAVGLFFSVLVEVPLVVGVVLLLVFIG